VRVQLPRRLSFVQLTSVLVFLCIACGAVAMPAQNDTWWHLRVGQEMWNSRSLMMHEVFSHTSAGSYWPNHEWLSQLTFFALYTIGGLPLLTAMAAISVVSAWAISWYLAGVNRGRSSVYFGLTALASASSWCLRPQVFTLALVAIAAWLLVTRRYRWLPPLFVLWANLHGGVLLGFVVLGGAALSESVMQRTIPWRLIGATVVCLVLAGLNPQGYSLWFMALESMHRLKAYGVDEWRRPLFLAFSNLPFWAIAALLVWTTIRQGRRFDHRQQVLVGGALAVLPLALNSQRNVGPFLILAVPAVAVWLPHFPRTSTAETPSRPCTWVAVTAALCLMAWATYIWMLPLRRLGWNPISPELVEKLASCEGRLYNRYDDGGYVLWFVPHRSVFIDSRQDPYSEALVFAQIAAERSGEHRMLFAQYQISCALVQASSPLASGLERDLWALRYADHQWRLFEQVSASPGP
jgi:hypothetical protein